MQAGSHQENASIENLERVPIQSDGKG